MAEFILTAVDGVRVGIIDTGKIVANLQEWDYGDYEGRRTADIRRERPDWITD